MEGAGERERLGQLLCGGQKIGHNCWPPIAPLGHWTIAGFCSAPEEACPPLLLLLAEH